MRPENEFSDSRRILVELLKQPGDGPVEIGELSDREREFFKVTCASNVLLHLICWVAGYDAAEACRGLTTLQMEKCIYAICDEDMPEGEHETAQ